MTSSFRNALIAGLGLAALSGAAQAAVVYDFEWYADEDYSTLIGSFRYVSADFITTAVTVTPSEAAPCTVTPIASVCAPPVLDPDSAKYNEADNDVVVFAYDTRVASRQAGPAANGLGGAGRHTSTHYFQDGAFSAAGRYEELVSEYFSVLTVSVEPDGVPEPATWALLLGGFGLTGAALRRRRLAAAKVSLT